MNIYRLTSVVNGETHEGTVKDLMHLNPAIYSNTLSTALRDGSTVGEYKVEKIGAMKNLGRQKVEDFTPEQTKINTEVNDFNAEARAHGMTYGQYDLHLRLQEERRLRKLARDYD